MNQSQLTELKEIFSAMTASLNTGNALVPSLEAGISKAHNPKIKQALTEALRGWHDHQDITLPFKTHANIFPNAIYNLTMAGFAGGFLEKTWEQAAIIIEDFITNSKETATFESNIVIFFDEMSLIDFGVPILVALESALADIKDSKIRAAIKEMISEVKKGNSIAAVCKHYPELFKSNIQNSLVEAENAGQVGSVSKQLATVLRK